MTRCLCFLQSTSLDACIKGNRRKLLDHPHVTCLYTGNKITRGKKTDQRCVVIGVRKKKEEVEIEKKWILPTVRQYNMDVTGT